MNIERKPINEIKREMNNDYLEIENSDGMPGMVDSTIAMDFLMAVKTGIRTIGVALTEIASPDARNALRTLLDKEIDLHAELSELMMKKGWLRPYEVGEQFKLDMISSKTALKIAGMNLYPGDTSRLGTFATPNY